METIINHLITTSVGLIIVAGAYFVDLLIGTVNVLFTPNMKWSFKKMFEDLVKCLLIGFSIELWVLVCDLIGWYANSIGANIAQVTDSLSVGGMFGAIVSTSIWYLKNAFDGVVKFIGEKHTKIEVTNPDSTIVSDKVKHTLEDIIASLTTKESVEAHQKAENEVYMTGGLGRAYSVNISSYDAFRSEVNGKGYDIDGCYGFQCWDGACLLWQQLGMWLQTGNGCASGCWTLKKEVNAGNQFELIYDKTQIRKGDIVVFGLGQYGHIGYADENYSGNTIALLAQNQSADMKFCVKRLSLDSFLGAFRYKGWVEKPVEKPTVTPTENVENSFDVGDKVVPTRLVDYNGTRLVQYDDVYEITAINGDRAVLSARGAVWAAMRTSDIRKV